MAATVGYLGSHGRDLRISRNINQPVNGVRPFAAVSASSPIQPGVPLGNITQVESSGFSNYDAAWMSLTRRLSRGSPVGDVVHVVEVARHQLAQFVAASRFRTAMTSPASTVRRISMRGTGSW